MLFIKKMERVFHLLTQLNVQMNLKIDMLDVQAKLGMEKPSQL